MKCRTKIPYKEIVETVKAGKIYVLPPKLTEKTFTKKHGFSVHVRKVETGQFAIAPVRKDEDKNGASNLLYLKLNLP